MQGDKLTPFWKRALILLYLLSFAIVSVVCSEAQTVQERFANMDQPFSKYFIRNDNPVTHFVADESSLLLERLGESSTAEMDSGPGYPSFLTDITPQMKAVFAIVAVIGTLDNLMVVFVILKTPSMRKSLANYFILNQSLIDLVSCLVLTIYPYFNHPDNVEGYLSKVIFCKVWSTRWFLWGLFQASTFNLICMAIERYAAVVYPLLHLHSFTKKKALSCMWLCWILGLASEGIYKILYSNYRHGICMFLVDLPGASSALIIGLYTFIVQYTLPLFIVGFASIRMWWTLRVKSTSTTNMGQAASSNRDLALEKARWNIVRTLIIVYLGFLICWSPTQVIYLCYNVGVYIDLSAWYIHFVTGLALLNSCINPIIYALQFKEFQNAVFDLVSKKTNTSGNIKSKY